MNTPLSETLDEDKSLDITLTPRLEGLPTKKEAPFLQVQIKDPRQTGEHTKFNHPSTEVSQSKVEIFRDAIVIQTYRFCNNQPRNHKNVLRKQKALLGSYPRILLPQKF